MGMNAPFHITQGGKNYLARAQTGETLTITKIVMSDDITDDNAEDITEVAHPVITVSPVDYLVTKNILRLRVDYTNAGLTEPFVFRVGAIYATVGDEPEIIYAAANAREAADIINPPVEGAAPITYFWDINVTVDNAQNVTVVLDEGVAYVRTQDKATAADIAAGTPGAWIDAAAYKDTVGDIINEIDLDAYVRTDDKATQADLAAATPGKWPDTALIAADQSRQDADRERLWAGLERAEAEIALIKEGNSSGITDNVFQIYFKTLEGISWGDAGDFVWDARLERLTC